MNESIGTKGGKNDRRRTLVVTSNAKKKLEEVEKKEKEDRKKKSIKRIDLETLIKIIPIILLGNTLEIIRPTKKENNRKETKGEKEKSTEQKERLTEIEILKKEKEEKKQPKKEEPIIKKENITFEDSTKKEEVMIEIKPREEEQKRKKQEIIQEIKQKDEEKNRKEQKQVTMEQRVSETEQKTIVEQQKNKKEELPKNIYSEPPKNKKEIKVNATAKIYNKKVKYTLKKITPIMMSAPLLIADSFAKKKGIQTTKQENATEKINRLTNVKLIEAYENELQNIRYDLKKLIFRYNNLIDEEKTIYTTEEIKDLINKLNEIIAKIEELKNKLDLDNISRYDDEYIRNTVNEYMQILGKGVVIDELKDSELYILLSNKIEELETKKDHFQEHVLTKEEDITYDEKEIEIMKKDYTNLQKFNKELETFQIKQERLLEYLQEKVANSERIEERVETTFTILNNQSKRLLQLLAASMMAPTLPGAKQVTIATLAYMYFFRKALKPKLQKDYKRYRKITIEDFSKDILNSINELNNIENLLHKSSLSLNDMINSFKSDYKEYIDNVPECRELLVNLQQMQKNLKEKEFDLKQIRREQQKNLEMNNDKVKVLRKEELIEDSSTNPPLAS